MEYHIAMEIFTKITVFWVSLLPVWLALAWTRKVLI